MSRTTSGVSSRLIWLLLLALIGVMFLYDWYTGTLKQRLAGQDEAIEQTELRLLHAEKKLDTASQEETRLKQQMDDITVQHEAKEKTLLGQLEEANRANTAFQSEMEEQKQAHADTLAAERQQAAETLAAERQQAADAYAALQADKEASEQQALAQQNEIEQLKQTLTQNTAQHEADLAAADAAFAASKVQLKRELGERIDYFRVALEGSKPELAAQLSTLDRQIESSRQALGEAEQTIESLRADNQGLNEQLGRVSQDRDAKVEALAQSAQDLEALQGQLSQRQNELRELQANLDSVKAQAERDLVALDTELQNTQAQFAQAQADATALLEKTKGEAAENLAATQAAAAAALQQAEADATTAMELAKAQHAAQIKEAEDKIAQLDQKLESEQSTLAALQQQFDAKTARLAETEQLLAGVKAELNMTQEQALQTKTTLEGQVAEAQARIAELQQTVATEREQAAQEKLSLEQDKLDSVAYVRGLLSEMSALGGRQTDQGMMFNLGKEQLRFRISSAKLPNREFPILDKLAGLLTKYPRLRARIEGHTDNTGQNETNLRLSQQRAETVSQELAKRGVEASRMESIGVGQIRPIADNNTPYGRALNRRVEVYVNEP